MSPYSQAALAAVEACRKNRNLDPVTAWNAAIPLFCKTLEGQKKSCPRNTFLGLCEAGLVAHIPTGNYTRSKLNKAYALKAVTLLQTRPKLADDPHALWLEVMRGGDEGKKPNGQMEIVIALRKMGLLKSL